MERARKDLRIARARAKAGGEEERLKLEEQARKWRELEDAERSKVPGTGKQLMREEVEGDEELTKIEQADGV